MINTSTFICQLPQELQNIIKDSIREYLTDNDYENIEELTEEAMSLRLTDLEDDINVTKILNKYYFMSNEQLINLCKKWDNETKGNMLDSIIEDIEEKDITLKESLTILVNEDFPVWIEEACQDDKHFYIDFQAKFKKVLESL